jgi:hypothetical protein
LIMNECRCGVHSKKLTLSKRKGKTHGSGDDVPEGVDTVRQVTVVVGPVPAAITKGSKNGRTDPRGILTRTIDKAD